MLSDDEFINRVWNKYDLYSQNTKNTNNFFNKNISKRNKYILLLKSVITFFISILSTVGIVYATISSYNYIQQYGTTNFSTNQNYDYNQNMIYDTDSHLYYKKITTYEEYKVAKKIWNNIIDMQITDFNEYFIIVLAGENYNTTNLYISNIYNTDSEICIELKKKDTWSEDNTVIFSKINKNMNRENIKIKNIPNELTPTSNYKNFDQLTADYSIEEALSDNCIVIDKNHNIISDNKNQFYDFINNCNNEKSDFIRLYICQVTRTIIYDIESTGTKINTVSKILSNNSTTYYNTGTSIIKISIPQSAGGGYTYKLLDEIGNSIIICSINE